MTKGAPLALHICPALPPVPAKQGDLAREITRATRFTHCLMCMSRASAMKCRAPPLRPQPPRSVLLVLGIRRCAGTLRIPALVPPTAPERAALRRSGV